METDTLHNYRCNRCGAMNSHEQGSGDFQRETYCIWGGCNGTAKYIGNEEITSFGKPEVTQKNDN